MVEDNQLWRAENFEAKIMHIPGHTTGHISFYFFKEKLIFTGDTLFSLGCGKIFEGTYEEMFTSLNKIKSLPEDTKIYCGRMKAHRQWGFPIGKQCALLFCPKH